MNNLAAALLTACFAIAVLYLYLCHRREERRQRKVRQLAQRLAEAAAESRAGVTW